MEMTVELRDAKKAWNVMNTVHADDMAEGKVVQEWGDTWTVDEDVVEAVVFSLTEAGVKVETE